MQYIAGAFRPPHHFLLLALRRISRGWVFLSPRAEFGPVSIGVPTMIDLNYLYHREQVELMRAQWGLSPSKRAHHLEQAASYAERIRVLRDVTDRNAAAGAVFGT